MVSKILKVTLACLIIIFIGCKEDKPKTELKSTGDAALDQLNQLISKDTTDKTLYFERAKIFYANNYFDGAINDLESAIKLDSLQPEYYHLLSDAYMDYSKSKDGLLTIEKCTKLFPERIPSLLKLAETQLILKQYENSLATTSRILTINENTAEAYFMMGMNLRSVSDLERAKVAFIKATEIDPDLVDAWIILGQIYEDEKDPKALDYYDAAINVDRQNPSTWHSKAYYLQNNDRISEALSIYRQINIIDKNYLDAYLNAGILHLSLDSIPQAYEQFDIMIKVKPQFYLSHYYRGIANEMLGRIDQAKVDYETSLKLNGNFVKAKDALEALAAKASEPN
ncbi:MAG: tetratricopeptide repeat protein [Saprospiraceae bacterium]|nr:tetratricopeptide repeat protein [Bacteroidia bacterium]NNE15946.1 tetratricopeptide repeat protein [Saprospiraceae bacterium]NNL93667.1 tetratricopeptide repeat protein [Saprospiraceae bacterium]